MKRFPILGFLLLVPAFALFAMIGCNTDKGKKNEDGRAGGDAVKADDKKKEKAVEIETPRKATVKGVVKLKGTAPKAEIDPRIAKHGSDATFCSSGPMASKEVQTWMVGKENELANVVVSLRPPLERSSRSTTSSRNSARRRSRSISRTAITTHMSSPCGRKSRGWSSSMMPQSPTTSRLPGAARSAIPISHCNRSPTMAKRPVRKCYSLRAAAKRSSTPACGSHTWMNCKIALFTNPYCAVTDKDGKFEIPNVPIDEKLTVYLWHESNPAKVEVKTFETKKGPNDLKVLDYAGK